MKTIDNEKWHLEIRSNGVIECFPYTFDRSQLIDVTSISDAFARFVYRKSSGIIDCETFYKAAINETN